MSIRRVVTGFNDAGTAAFVSDEQTSVIENMNTTLSSVWRSDSVADLQIPPATAVDDGYGFPESDGAWVLSWTIPPRSIAGEDHEQSAVTDTGDLPSGSAHATQSIDVSVITHGTAAFTLDDGSQRVLNTGDVIVVNGVKHSWSNPGDVEARIMSVIVGAKTTDS